VFSQEEKPAPAVAAKYQTVPVAEAYKSDKVVREKERVKDDMLRGNTAYNERDISEFYMSYVIPRMTSLESPELCNDSRRRILEDIDKVKSDAIVKPFNQTLLTLMDRIANGNFQPAAAINATLIIGRLNDIRSSNNAPKPMTSAAGKLLKLAVNGKNDGIRAAALEGLERHLKLGQASWSENQKQVVADSLIKTLTESQPTQRSNRSHAWLLGRSLELLTQIKHKNEERVYQFAMDKVAATDTDPLLLEKALLVIGTYKPTQIKPETVTIASTNTIAYLVKQAKVWHSSVVAPISGGSFEDYQSVGQGGKEMEKMMQAQQRQGMPGIGGMPSAKEKKVKKVNPYEDQASDVKVKRRELHQLLETVRFGIDGIHFGPTTDTPATGLSSANPEDPNKVTLAELVTAIGAMQTALNDVKIEDKNTLGTETREAFDALIVAAEAYPGVAKETFDGSTETIAVKMDDLSSTPSENGDVAGGEKMEAAAAENEVVAPAAETPPAGDGFN